MGSQRGPEHPCTDHTAGLLAGGTSVSATLANTEPF